MLAETKQPHLTTCSGAPVLERELVGDEMVGVFCNTVDLRLRKGRMTPA